MDLLTVIGHVSAVLGILGTLAAFGAWVQATRVRREAEEDRRRRDELISITLRLEGAGEELRLPVKIRRGDLTRSELQGLIGQIPMKPGPDGRQPRYKIAFLFSDTFNDAVRAVRSVSGETDFVIPLTASEVDQFDAPFVPIASGPQGASPAT